MCRPRSAPLCALAFLLVLLPYPNARGQAADPDEALVRRVLAEADAATEGLSATAYLIGHGELARVRARLGDEEGARDRLRAAVERAVGLPLPDEVKPWRLAEVLDQAARIQVELGDRDGARATWTLALRSLERGFGPAELRRVAWLVLRLAEFGMADEARRLLPRIDAAFADVPTGAYDRAGDAEAAAAAHAATGDLDGAFALVGRLAARPVADALDESSRRNFVACALAGIAAGVAASGRADAIAVLDRVLREVDALPRSSSRDVPLDRIARALARCGEFDRALETARRIGLDPDRPDRDRAFLRVMTLCDLARDRRESGAIEAARRVLDEAAADTHAVLEPEEREAPLRAVAIGRIDAGDLDGARHCVDQIHPGPNRTAVLLRLADAERRGADFEAADATLRRVLAEAEAQEGGASTAAHVHARLGDFGSARALALAVAEPGMQLATAIDVARLQAAAGEGEAARAWLESLDLSTRRAAALTALLDGLAEHAEAAR